MCSYIASVEALDRFRADCKRDRDSLLAGRSQLCCDALLFISPVSRPESASDPNYGTAFHSRSYTASYGQERRMDSPSHRLPIVLSGDDYLIDLISKCKLIKIIFPCTVSFSGFVDVSLLKSCTELELIGIPFQRVTGLESVRQNVQRLVWNRGYEEHERGNFQIFKSGDFVNDRTFKIDEVFWDQFGEWPSLKYLSFARSSLLSVNTSTMPKSITTLNLSMNRISRFNNHSGVSANLTKLCLDFNQLLQIPKLDSVSASKIVYLSLRGNLITNVKELQKFQGLRFLDLSSNSITDIREFLTEVGHLYRSLTTLAIEDNPVCFHKDFDRNVRFALYKLTSLNGKTLRPRAQNQSYEGHSPIVVPNYGTAITESFPPSQSSSNDLEDSIQRSRRERIVMINENDNEHEDLEQTVRRASDVPGASSAGNLPRRLITTKNYLFGDVSGSYGSYGNNQLDLSHSSNQNQEELHQEREKLLEKRKELGENWLLNGGQSPSIVVIPASLKTPMEIDEIREDERKDKGDDKAKDKEKDEDECEDKEIKKEGAKEKAGPTVGKKERKPLDDTSEWALEDTQEEENVFLVESYDSWSSLTTAQLSDFQDQGVNSQILFVRFRPDDLLLFEKDCTSGKILTTLDLKVLETFQSLNDSKETVPIAVQLLFDTSVLTKRERVYRFVEDGQCVAFLDILAQRNFSPKVVTKGKDLESSVQFSSTPLKDNVLWLYLCLRCGSKTQRIITDCPDCGSQLIVKDVGERLESSISTPIAATPTNGGVPMEEKKDSKEPKESRESRNSTGSAHEVTYHFEASDIDETYFDSENVDHVLKLMTEVAIYELSKSDKDAGEVLKSQSVRSVCDCLTFNFETKLFMPALVVFSEAFIFLFDKSDKDQELKVKFYYPFVGPHQFVLSHLPDFMKNHAFWFQYLPFNQSRKRTNRKRDKKAKAFDPNSPHLELLMFDDKAVGKAFLEHLFQAHRVCYRKQEQESSLQRNLPVIKPDITDVIHDTVSPNHDSRIGAVLDEQLTAIIDDANVSQFNDKDNTLGTNFFLIKSFALNLESKGQQRQETSKAGQDLLKVEQNILLLICKESFVLCQLSGHFYAISQAITSGSSASLAKLLRSKVKFDDHIELQMLMKDCLLNLLPTVYVCEEKNRIILKFRDENGAIMSFTNSFAIGEGEGELESSGKSGLMVYDFQLDFCSLHTMKRVLQLVMNVWEHHFGVSLTLSVAKF